VRWGHVPHRQRARAVISTDGDDERRENPLDTLADMHGHLYLALRTAEELDAYMLHARGEHVRGEHVRGEQLVGPLTVPGGGGDRHGLLGCRRRDP